MNKLELLREFDTNIAPQKLLLEQQMPDLWRQCYGSTFQQPAPAAAAGKSGRGPSSKAGRGAAAAEDLDPRVDQMLKECLNIINKKLWGHKPAHWFKKPVIPDEHNVPNYFLFVKKPMDLGTIRGRLMGTLPGPYRSPIEVKDDVNLVWNNCRAYNQEGTPARNDGETCRSIWERAWRDNQIEEQWQQFLNEQDPMQGAMLPHEAASVLNSKLVKAVEALPSVSRLDGPRQEMSFAEKRRLSQQLGRIQSEQLQGVLDIVAKDPRVSMAADGEIEMDIDALKADTLWKLQELVERPAGSRPAQSKALSARPTPSPPAPTPAASAPAPGSTAEKKLAARVTASVQSSGGASDSDSGEHSPRDVKGSSMDEPGRPAFARPGRDAGNLVDESATNPKEQSVFVKDRAAARKPDVSIDTANWNSLTTVQDAAEAQPEAGGNDDVWKSFQSIAEQKQQREDQLRQEAEQAEKLRREEQERQKQEEEERQRKLKEEEEKQQAEMQKQRDEQLQKEVAEIQAKAGTANLTQQGDVLANMPVPAADGLAAAGLEYRDNDEDMNFEDD